MTIQAKIEENYILYIELKVSGYIIKEKKYKLLYF